MTKWPHLERAPIVEGLIDIRIGPPTVPDLAPIEALCDALADEFPSRQERRRWTGQIVLNPQSPVSVAAHHDEVDGYFLRSADERHVAQFRLDGFTFSRLQPYTHWADLRAQSMALWSRYRQAILPAKVQRVAVRFINRIPLPQGAPFEQIFKTTFSIAPSLPQHVAGFLLRIALPFEAQAATAIVSQTNEPQGSSCIFDIDVFADNPQGFDEDELWTKLDRLREIKNKVFFESLMPEVLETFK